MAGSERKARAGIREKGKGWPDQREKHRAGASEPTWMCAMADSAAVDAWGAQVWFSGSERPGLQLYLGRAPLERLDRGLLV